LPKPKTISDGVLRALHVQLLAADPVAPANLATHIVQPLVDDLQRIPWVRRAAVDEALIYSAVADALLSYVKEPSAYQPAKRSLWGYLRMAAVGDLKNALGKDRRRREKEKLVPSVEKLEAGGNRVWGEAAHRDDAGGTDLSAMASELRERILGAFKDPKDKAVAELLLDQVSDQKRYVEALGLGPLPPDEERKVVARAKDRVGQRLRREWMRQREEQ